MNKEEFKNKLTTELIITKQKEQLDVLTDTLMEQLMRFRDLDINNKDTSDMEIKRGNAVSNIGKTIIQSIAMKQLIEKNK